MNRNTKSSMWLLPLLLAACMNAHAHGSVGLADDQCVIQIGFYSAHFAIYQPQTRQHEDYCEDIPDVTDSIFVIEYLHAVMREVPVDFRIIKDRENRGKFVRWEDLESVDDLDRDTVFYQSPVTRPDGVFLVHHEFSDSGDYIGIVTTRHPTLDKTYTSVFPFHVGEADWGYVPLFVGIAILLQINYWFMTGGFARWRDQRKGAARK
jgi:hypothetical protein